MHHEKVAHLPSISGKKLQRNAELLIPCIFTVFLAGKVVRHPVIPIIAFPDHQAVRFFPDRRIQGVEGLVATVETDLMPSEVWKMFPYCLTILSTTLPLSVGTEIK